MPSNLELKAHFRFEGDVADLITHTPCSMLICTTYEDGINKKLVQHDTFYNADRCRLKLRRENGVPSLIAYDRRDQAESKISDYEIAAVQNAGKLNKVLEKALGIIGEVKKERDLFIVEAKGLRTRIHIDMVEGLGKFIEFEVLIQSDNQIPIGQELLEVWKKYFMIKDEDLITGSYMDELLKKI